MRDKLGGPDSPVGVSNLGLVAFTNGNFYVEFCDVSRNFPLMVRQHKSLHRPGCSEVEIGTLMRKIEGKKKNASL